MLSCGIVGTSVAQSGPPSIHRFPLCLHFFLLAASHVLILPEAIITTAHETIGMAPYNAAVAPVWQGKIAVEEAMNLPELAENISGAPSYVGGAGERRTYLTVLCRIIAAGHQRLTST